MSKKFLAVCALAVASLFTFVGCSGESYNFTALTDNPSATDTVSSNGGVYVEKGKYSYFVNGAENGAGLNNFGDEHKGAIVRCLTADLTSPDRNVEVVVPKIIYSEDADSSGFYIFGDRIYYTTPNNGKDSNGNVLYTKLDFMSAKLDGTDTQRLATTDDIAKPFVMVQNGDGVYIFYEGTDTIQVNGTDTSVKALYEIDAAAKTVKMIDNDIASYSFDRTEGAKGLAYTKTLRKTVAATGKEETESRYNELYGYNGGDEKPFLIDSGDVENEADINYQNLTVRTVAYGEVYYTYEQSITAAKGLKKATDADDAKVLANKVYENFLPVKGEDAIYIQDGGWIKKLTFANGSVSGTGALLCSESGDITLEKVVGNRLFYTIEAEYVLYGISVDETNQTSKVVVDGRMQGTTWASFDYALRGEGENRTVAVFYFNDTDTDNMTFVDYLYMDVFGKDDEGKDKITSKRIGKLIQSDLEYAQENGDDKNAVDKID